MFKVKICIVVLGVLICTSSASGQKVERFTDSKGTVHIGTQPDVKPGNNTKPEAKPEVKPEAKLEPKPGDIAKPEGEQPFQRKILPKSQRASRRPVGQHPLGEFPPRQLPPSYQRGVVKPQPAQPGPLKEKPGPEGSQQGSTP